MSSSPADQQTGSSNKSDYYETSTTTKNDSTSSSTTTDSSAYSPSASASSPGGAVVVADTADNANVTTAANADGASSSTTTSTPSKSESSHDDQQGELSSSSSSSTSTIRDVVGTGSIQLSDAINENIIIARYITIASIGLLTAYGISHTPLFSRFKTVSDIPSSYFVKRKSITCRIIQQTQTQTRIPAILPLPPEGPIQLQVRNLSPFERILPLSLYDWFMKMHPASALALSGKMRPDENSDQLLQVELAGVQTPPDYLSYEKEQYGDWFTNFVKQRPVVKCQLLARRVILDNKDDAATGKRSTSLSQHQKQGGKTFKRQIPGFEIEKKDDKDLIQYSPNQIAHCKIYYRPEWLQLFSTDLAASMVLNGRASVLSDGNGLYGRRGSNEKIVDTQSTSVNEIRKDVMYVDQLLRAEQQAASEMRGMWSDSNVRDNHKPDLMKEIEFQSNATLWQKLYRFLKGG